MKILTPVIFLILTSFSCTSQPQEINEEELSPISFLLRLQETSPKKESQIKRINQSIKSDDLLESTLAKSILFKHFPTKENRELIIEAFKIPYEDSRRSTMKKFYTSEELKKIWSEINAEYASKYQISEDEWLKLGPLVTFIEYRKRKVWIYKNEHFAEPSNIVARGIYLRLLLHPQLDYKKLISEIIARVEEEHKNDSNK